MTETRKAAEKEYGLESGGFFKVKDGANKVRLLSQTIPHQSFYKGTKTFKYVCWIFDYSDMKVKLYFMPTTIYKHIENLQLSDDYSFEEVPMPFDITINVKNAGSKEVEYSTTPARNNTELCQECVEQFVAKEQIEAVVAKLKENESTNPTNAAPVEDYSNGYQPAPNTGDISTDELNKALSTIANDIGSG